MVATSHKRSVPSRLALANKRPSGLKATSLTQSVCWSNNATCSPLSTRQTRTEPSRLPVASKLPSGLNEDVMIQPLCPLRLWIASKVSVSHSKLTGASPASEAAKTLPFGETLMSVKRASVRIVAALICSRFLSIPEPQLGRISLLRDQCYAVWRERKLTCQIARIGFANQGTC